MSERPEKQGHPQSGPQKKRRKKKKQPKPSLWKKLSVVAFFLLVLLGAGGVYGAYQWLDQRFYDTGPLTQDQAVIIEKGSGVSAITRHLAQAGVIEHPDLFRVMLRLKRMDTRLQAGEFLFPAGVSAFAAAKILREGQPILHQITIAEGLTVSEVVAQIHQAPLLRGEITELPPEGSVLPETYSFTRGTARTAVLRQMQDAMTAALRDAWATRDDGLPLKSAEEALILASIIEKETAVAAERGQVAGVFVNRLRKRMRLQTDPTVIYGITLGRRPLGRGLTRTELKTPTPYNTYTIFGLPPTPIANPGRASLMAAVQPETTDALYFVADGTGGHAFARTLKEHNRNVAKWRKIERKRK